MIFTDTWWDIYRYKPFEHTFPAEKQRIKHTKRTQYCIWCSFGSTEESVMENHIKQFKYTHTYTQTNDRNKLSDNKEQVIKEISDMREMGFLLYTGAAAYRMFRNYL